MKILLNPEGLTLLIRGVLLRDVYESEIKVHEGIHSGVKYKIYITPLGVILNHTRRIGRIVEDSYTRSDFLTNAQNDRGMTTLVSIERL